MVTEVRVLGRDRKIIVAPGACMNQARFNREHAYKDLDLRIVVGSLGIGVNKKVFYEYGSVDWKSTDQFKAIRDTYGRQLWDAHFWLESYDGHVYDIVTPNIKQVAMLRGLDMRFKTDTIIEGRSKKRLSKQGLHYIPAPIEVQQEILEIAVHDFNSVHDYIVEMFNK